MKREIKFRAWNKKQKKMFQVERIDFDFDTGNRIETVDIIPENPQDDHPSRSIHSVELMQFTGLKDRFGNEIYEGDIINGYGGAEWNGCYEFDLWGVIKYMGAGFFLSQNNDEERYNLTHLYENMEIEVKANIYENPKFLED